MIIVYTLVENIEQAKALAYTLVEEKLAACINLIPKVHSVFFWDNQVQEAQEEVAILIKTVKHLEDKVYQKLKEIHPYECPAICTINIEKVEDGFFNWIKNTVGSFES